MNRILITGATGYIGSALVPLLARRFRIRAVDTEFFGNPIAQTPNVEFVRADITNLALLSDLMRNVTAIIHLAGIVTDELVDMNPLKAMRVNLLGTMNVIRAAEHNKVARLIYASSSSIYGSQVGVATEDTPPKPQSIYASTKLLGEEIVNSANDAMTVVSVRCATCCGPAPRFRADTIVNTFCKQAYFDKRITVWGGDQYRTNAHILDVVDLYETLLIVPGETINREVFNMTSGNHTAAQLGRMVNDIAGGDLVIDTSKQDHRSYRMDANKLFDRIGFRPQRTIDDAIRDNLAWFASGSMVNPDADIWYNTRRMAPLMKG